MPEAIFRPRYASPLLIMTATIAPPAGATKLARIDPLERLADYLRSLEWQMELLKAGVLSKIVFVENSGYDLGSLVLLAKEAGLQDEIEFISFYGLDYPPQHGRAFGEFLLLRHAMQVSSHIAAASNEQIIWKLTGRYIVVNLRRILATVDLDKDLFVHFRNHPSPWADMYLMGWRKESFYRFIAPMHASLKENEFGASAETAFRDMLDKHPQREKVQARLRPPPQLVGIRGFDNAAYHEQALKSFVRRFFDIAAPWLWI